MSFKWSKSHTVNGHLASYYVSLCPYSIHLKCLTLAEHEYDVDFILVLDVRYLFGDTHFTVLPSLPASRSTRMYCILR